MPLLNPTTGALRSLSWTRCGVEAQKPTQSQNSMFPSSQRKTPDSKDQESPAERRAWKIRQGVSCERSEKGNPEFGSNSHPRPLSWTRYRDADAVPSSRPPVTPGFWRGISYALAVEVTVAAVVWFVWRIA